MATIQRFEDLLCWQKSRLLVKEVYNALRNCRDKGFTDQIQRASVSVLSNIAEGFESGTKDELLNYLYIAKASAGEVRAQTYVGFDVGYLNIQTFKYINGLAEECSKLLNSFIVKVKQGGMGGLQRKAETMQDAFTEDLRAQGYVMTINGLKKRDVATQLGLKTFELK